VLKYRVPARKGLERHAAALQDGQRAMSLVRHQAKSRGFDPGRIGVLGFSAGGHLAALLCSGPAERTYPAVDEADTVDFRPSFGLLIYPAYLATKTNELAPPLKPTDRTPPTFLVQTEDDGVRVESSLVYYQALKNAKVSAEMHLYPSGGHGYGLRPSASLVSTWPRRAEEWMNALGVLQAPAR
jgi:acetyl esterase/lipase